MNSQNELIRKRLESGKSITPLQALKLYGCFRLGARIWDLKNKQGLKIKTDLVTKNNKTFAEYKLSI